jgi:hypothetical protein
VCSPISLPFLFSLPCVFCSVCRDRALPCVFSSLCRVYFLFRVYFSQCAVTGMLPCFFLSFSWSEHCNVLFPQENNFFAKFRGMLHTTKRPGTLCFSGSRWTERCHRATYQHEAQVGQVIIFCSKNGYRLWWSIMILDIPEPFHHWWCVYFSNSYIVLSLHGFMDKWGSSQDNFLKKLFPNLNKIWVCHVG